MDLALLGISKFNMSSVTDTSVMFRHAEDFDGDISGWDVSSVTRMDAMFLGADKFNGDISGWDVSNVKNLAEFATRAETFAVDLCPWGLKLPKDVHFGDFPPFRDTACPNEIPPNMDRTPPGPFCHDCN